MKLKKLLVVLLAAMMLLGTTTAVFAATESYSDTAGNYFFSDSDATVKNGHYFGIFGTGNNIIMENTVSDDALALAGRNIELNGAKVDGSAFAAAYGIHFSGAEVKGNIMAAGHDLSIDTGVSANAVYMAGNDVAFRGTAKAVGMVGKTAIIGGTVEGDVSIIAEKVTIEENTNITGTLKIKAEEEPQLPANAKVGKVEFTKSVEEQPQQQTMQDKAVSKVKESIFTLISMFILGLAICLIFPRQLDVAVTIFKESKVKMLLMGLLFLILAPVIFVILCITGVGAPLGIVGILLYIIFMIIAVPFMGASIVRKRIPKIPGIIPSLIGVVIFQLLMIVPYLSAVIYIFAVLYTFGFILLYTFGKGRGKKKVDEKEDAEEDEENYIESIPESVEMNVPEVVVEAPQIVDSEED